jgi:hypothetical protein
MRVPTFRPWSRRDFLRAAGIGASAAALSPFIPVPAEAAPSAGIKRLLLFAHGNGTILNRWRSNGTGAPLASGALLPQLAGPILAPLDRHRSAITLVDGLDNASGGLPRPGATQGRGAGHEGIASLWSGARLVPAPPSGIADPCYANAATIDQILAQSSSTRFPSVVTGTNPRAKQTYNPTEAIAAYSGPGTPVIPEDDPQVTFDLLFSSGVDGSANAALQRRASRLSILSSVRGELSRLRNELPAVDRERLDLHVSGLDSLDRRIAGEQIQPCTAPAAPGVTSSSDPVTRLRLHTEIVAHAFACDLTRIANVLLCSEASTDSWLPGYGGLHTYSHLTYIASTEDIRRQAVDAMTLFQNAAAEEFSKILDVLDAGPGPTLLEDTLVAWGTGMGWGGPHVNYSIPFVVASKHPAFRAGYYHRYGNYDLNIDTSVPANPYQPPTLITPHNKLLTTIMHLMGRADIQAVGDVGTGGQQGGADIDNAPFPELIS